MSQRGTAGPNRRPEPHPSETEHEAQTDLGSGLYGIGDLAQELDVTQRAIRFYEARGLITPRRVGANRVYDRRDRARLILILRGKRLGFSLDEIAEYLSLYDSEPTQTKQLRHLLDKVESAIAELQEKKADVERTIAELEAVRAECLRNVATAAD